MLTCFKSIGAQVPRRIVARWMDIAKGHRELDRNIVAGSWAAGIAPMLLFFLLSACVSEDHRFVNDVQDCSRMGHTQGTPEFANCLSNLNDRRCAANPKKGGHVSTHHCTRLENRPAGLTSPPATPNTGS